MYFIATVVLAFAVAAVNAAPTGAPAAACIDMTPQHGFEVQSDPPPYDLHATRDGNLFTVLLEDDTPDNPFKGFLIQARNVATNTIVGAFTEIPAEAQFLNCLVADNSVTHVDPSLKSALQFTWDPQGADLTGVYFVATVVKDVATYWINIRSEELSTLP